MTTIVAQYVSATMEFGTDEFFEVFDAAVGKENVPPRIGKPALFVFTPKGKVVFAGSNQASGIKVDDEFKQTLVRGLSETGSLARPPLKIQDPADVYKRLQILIREKEYLAAGRLLSEIYSNEIPQTGPYSDGQLRLLSKLADLPVPIPSLGGKIDKQARRVFTIAEKLTDTELKAVKSGKKTGLDAAIEIEKLSQAFSNFPGGQEVFLEAQAVLAKETSNAGLTEQAKQAVAAGSDVPESTLEQSNAHTAGEVETNLGGEASGETKSVSETTARTWTSRDGKFSVKARLLRVKGSDAYLQTTEKEIQVPLKMLSQADLDYLDASDRSDR